MLGRKHFLLLFEVVISSEKKETDSIRKQPK
jgi:hypothetical protein